MVFTARTAKHFAATAADTTITTIHVAILKAIRAAEILIFLETLPAN